MKFELKSLPRNASDEEIIAEIKRVDAIVGEDLLRQNYASIYTVGRASDDAPRLLDLRWGNPAHAKVTLVGKGVCFDSGGLDIKPSAYMLLMKKDMAGAAHVLGLARMIMAAKLPMNLRVLIPVVENVIAGNAYRPGDIITSRKGLTIEVGNTDAEGRVILADALTEAVNDNPALLIDITTLTGAARIALGTDLPELTLAVRSVLTRKEAVAMGDYVGAAAASTLLFGIFTLLHGGEVLTDSNFAVTFVFIALSLILFFFFSRSKSFLSRNEGLILFGVYLIFITVELALK